MRHGDRGEVGRTIGGKSPVVTSWAARGWLSTPAGRGVAAAVVPALFVTATGLFVPFQRPLELDPDEGINAVKALLVVRGAPIYGAEWNDQPPLFAHLLAVAVRLFGHHVVVGRWLVLVLAAVLLWSAVSGLAVAWDRRASLAGMALLWLLPTFPRLSVSVMIGLPALALAVLSWAALVRWHARGRVGWASASGAALGLSILTKGSSFLLVPLMIGGVLLSGVPRGAARPRPWPALLAWTGALLLTWLTLSLAWVGVANLGAWVAPHAAARRAAVTYAHEVTLRDLLVPVAPVLVLAVGGAALAVRRRRGTLLYLAAWMGAAIGALAVHRPLWYHHALLISVPAALLAAAAVAEALATVARRDSRRRDRVLAVLGLTVAGWFVAVRVVALPGELAGLGAPDPADLAIRDQVARGAGQTHWMLSDRPLFGFENGLAPPPGLAVISQKRVATGALGEEDLLAALERWRPEQVLLCRLRVPRVERALAGLYRQVASVAGRRLYWRRDMLTR